MSNKAKIMTEVFASHIAGEIRANKICPEESMSVYMDEFNANAVLLVNSEVDKDGNMVLTVKKGLQEEYKLTLKPVSWAKVS